MTMKIFIVLCTMLLCGCASLLPNAVNPGFTTVSNTAMALVAASAGDCSVPIGIPDVGAACANRPTATTTIDQDRQAFEACLAAAANARLATQVAAVKASMPACIQAVKKP